MRRRRRGRGCGRRHAGKVEPSEGHVDFNPSVFHLDDGDVGGGHRPQIAHLGIVLQHLLKRVKVLIPGDVLWHDAQGVDVCTLVGDAKHVRAVSNDPTSQLVRVLPVHPHAEADAMDPTPEQKV